jgi:hypothetical protein
VTLHREALAGAKDGDQQARELLRGIEAGIERNWGVPPLFDVETPSDLLPPQSSVIIASALVEQALGPLANGIRAHVAAHGPLVIDTLEGHEYVAREVSAYDRRLEALMFPLTVHVCLDFVRAISDLRVTVFDPGKDAPLAVERGHYARERTKLIRAEHRLWELAGSYGALSDRIPYATRVLLLIVSWIPEAHEPPGAYTLCLRCGGLLFRRRRTFSTLPRCATCMKETPSQREWPPHAMAPDDVGTWLLRCQYPDCDLIFNGPRHRKLCPEHTSARLPPRRRGFRLAK